MASPISHMTVTPDQPSPLARTISPFKDPRPAPSSTSARTAKLWDEYEKVAVENARKRNRMAQTPHLHRDHAQAVREAYRSSVNTEPRRTHVATPSTIVATCGDCKQPITFASGICESCRKTIIMPVSDNHTTSTQPSSPTTDPASTSIRLSHKNSFTENANIPTLTPPKQQSFCPMPTQFANPPIRLSSLRPPPTPETAQEPSRSRKISLTDPNEPFLRLQISKQLAQAQAQAPSPCSNPPIPTFPIMPATPPSTSHSYTSTCPSSLATTTTPFATFPYARNNSATPSDLSTLCPYASTDTTSPPSLRRVNYALQNTTSAWDAWDSDGEGQGEKSGLVAWMGRRKDKARRDRSGKGSMESFESMGMMDARTKKADARRSGDILQEQVARSEMVQLARVDGVESLVLDKTRKKKKRPRGFLRVISCGCSRE